MASVYETASVSGQPHESGVTGTSDASVAPDRGLNIGDRVILKGKLKEFETPTNPGGFNAKTYYESIGVEFGFSAKSVEVIEAGTSEITALSENLKMRMTESFKKVADERDAGLCISVVLGDKQDLLEDIDELYRNSGISHLIAISGMHISLIGMAVYSLLRKGGIKFLPCAIISVAIILFYGMMTGNAVSTVRAVVMFSVSTGAGVAGRTYDILSSTSLSLLYILIINAIFQTIKYTVNTTVIYNTKHNDNCNNNSYYTTDNT